MIGCPIPAIVCGHKRRKICTVWELEMARDIWHGSIRAPSPSHICRLCTGSMIHGPAAGVPADSKSDIMLVSNVTGNDSVTRRERRADGSPFGETVERRSRRKIRRFDRPSVAHLAIGTIAEMSREELIRVIDGSDLPLINSSNRRRLKYLDRATLARLAQLGRRCCRNQGY